jgi:methionyl-tRNA formyltransferase
MSTSKTIVFFGSGPVAAASLELLARNFDIEAVVTKPQPPHHKQPFPVIAVAEKLGLKTLFTSDKAALVELFNSRPVNSEIGVVIDYGIIIPSEVIDYFPLGIINSHFSLLPRWRGADPISFAILNGDEETGVSVMVIVPALDEGPLLTHESLRIAPDATTPSLTDELVTLSDKLLTEVLPLYVDGRIQPLPQPAEGVSYSRKLDKSDSQLDWSKPAPVLEREIRAFTGWPRSRARLGSTDVVITRAHAAEGSGTPGEVWRDGKQFGVYTSDGLLIIDALIPAGKKEMPAESYLAGYQL